MAGLGGDVGNEKVTNAVARDGASKVFGNLFT
jgi:hypothetical protein